MVGAQETKGWGPGNQWFASRKQIVVAEDINVGQQETNCRGRGD